MKQQKKHCSKTGYAISGKQLQVLIKVAIKAAKPRHREICGVIVSNGYCLEFVRTRNVAKGPGCFELPMHRVRKIEKAARKLSHHVVGTFHSHPVSSAEPGESDIAGTGNGTLMLIISCWDKEAKLWHIRKPKAIPVPLHDIDL